MPATLKLSNNSLESVLLNELLLIHIINNWCSLVKGDLVKGDLVKGDLLDNDTDKFYTVCEFASPNNKFYTLSDVDDDDFKVYILSEKKYRELRQKIDDQQGGIDDENDIDIGEQQI